jgi:hypothetical protein
MPVMNSAAKGFLSLLVSRRPLSSSSSAFVGWWWGSLILLPTPSRAGVLERAAVVVEREVLADQVAVPSGGGNGEPSGFVQLIVVPLPPGRRSPRRSRRDGDQRAGLQRPGGRLEGVCRSVTRVLYSPVSLF